jgi:release factor glutamine methyltransferase
MPADTISQILTAARDRLARAGCDQASLDARLLLQAAAGLSHADIVAWPGRTIGEDALARFQAFLDRRSAHEPVSRILGCREFYGRAFLVSPDVLDPRPDTETLVDAALAAMMPGIRVLDLGTGSGAIIVTLLAECPSATGVAVDISEAALRVARGNAEALGVAARLAFTQGSWFQPVTGRFGLIVSNPPYIPDHDIDGLAPDVKDFDPHGALAGGADGLDAYRAIAAGAMDHLETEGSLLVEIGAGQAQGVTGIFAGHGFRPAGQHRDLGGHVRSLAFRPA